MWALLVFSKQTFSVFFRADRQNGLGNKRGHELEESKRNASGGTCNLLTEHKVMRRWSRNEQGERVQEGAGRVQRGGGNALAGSMSITLLGSLHRS